MKDRRPAPSFLNRYREALDTQAGALLDAAPEVYGRDLRRFALPVAKLLVIAFHLMGACLVLAVARAVLASLL